MSRRKFDSYDIDDIEEVVVESTTSNKVITPPKLEIGEIEQIEKEVVQHEIKKEEVQKPINSENIDVKSEDVLKFEPFEISESDSDNLFGSNPLKESNMDSSVFDSFDSVYNPIHQKDEDNEVKLYPTSKGLKFPLLMLRSKADSTIPSYIINVLSNMLIKEKYLSEGTPGNYYNVYITDGETTVDMGLLQGDFLRGIIQGSIYNSLDKYIQISEDKIIEGELMLSYSTSPHY